MKVKSNKYVCREDPVKNYLVVVSWQLAKWMAMSILHERYTTSNYVDSALLLTRDVFRWYVSGLHTKKNYVFIRPERNFIHSISLIIKITNLYLLAKIRACHSNAWAEVAIFRKFRHNLYRLYKQAVSIVVINIV